MQFNAVEFGRLMASVQHLSEQLESTEAALDKLNDRIGALEAKTHWGQGAVWVFVTALGFALLGAVDTIRGWVSR